MGEAVRYTIGSEVRCADGKCGSVKRVVIDPIARCVTHLVVAPGGGEERLVPVSLLDSEADGIELSCGRDEFEALESAEEDLFLPGGANDLGYDPAETMRWPYFGPGIALAGGMNPLPLTLGEAGVPTARERVPAGEVQIRRGDPVRASDGEAGRVHGLVVDDGDHTVTHVLLGEGHLWGRKTVAVPIADVERAGATIRVNYSKDQLKDLPAVDTDAEG
ncbi:PRC-barrel domain-containing protein [Streptomyces sp. 8L]|uniref:PRC-barrel domain-containing protein n=1 Tax=Streptomyces sp. 8L TaxID=2877242 RepID=UPI001CD3DA5B|nr:PRC-barrel domain-containing protein [Streptomyces sp. 8L]MCA1217505.1 PRC-barrel domain-containing protein [Streptomyces sp. 8L]